MSKKLGLPGKAADRVAVLTGIHPTPCTTPFGDYYMSLQVCELVLTPRVLISCKVLQQPCALNAFKRKMICVRSPEFQAHAMLNWLSLKCRCFMVLRLCY